MDARALSIVLTGLLATTQVLAAPINDRRALRVSGEKYKNLSKKAQIILISSICGVIGLVLIGFIIFVVWVKKDVGEKIRDRTLDWRIKRRVSRSTRRILKELEAMPDPPSTATATAQPNSSAKNDNSRDNLMAPSSPKSKAATDISTSSEKEQQQQLPPYTETAEIRMPQPAHIQSQPDPSAPVPYTRELKP